MAAAEAKVDDMIQQVCQRRAAAEQQEIQAKITEYEKLIMQKLSAALSEKCGQRSDMEVESHMDKEYETYRKHDLKDRAQIVKELVQSVMRKRLEEVYQDVQDITDTGLRSMPEDIRKMPWSQAALGGVSPSSPMKSGAPFAEAQSDETTTLFAQVLCGSNGGVRNEYETDTPSKRELELHAGMMALQMENMDSVQKVIGEAETLLDDLPPDVRRDQLEKLHEQVRLSQSRSCSQAGSFASIDAAMKRASISSS